MVKELLSDFDKITQPSYLPDSFQPYLSMILTIITITILVYGIQSTTTDIHTYAAKPISLNNTILRIENCADLTKTSLQYICNGMGSNADKNTQSDTLLSFEQDLHNSIK